MDLVALAVDVVDDGVPCDTRCWAEEFVSIGD